MTLALFAHPFSSYCQKVLVALYENDTPFTLRQLGRDDPATSSAFEALWPLKRFPLLLDGDRPVFESSVIIEYLGLHHPGPVQLLPDDPAATLEVRFLDRFFDNYVQTSLQKIVSDTMRAEGGHDVPGVAEARSTLDVAYAWLDGHMAGREWAAGASFSLADCAAAPALFYADWTHAIGDRFPQLRAYRGRLNARPSFKRAIEGARPYRAFFPLGAPDRD